MHINGVAQYTDSSLAIFAHELREPLASILFAAQSVGEMTGDELINREMWSIVERQSRYLARIIDQVMELSRGSHGKLVLSKDWFDLGTMITTAVETVKPLLTNRGHRLTVSMPPGQVCVFADALRMQQVVVNLLTNAAKYTEPGGRIALDLEVANDLVVIEVRDNGTGIPEELLPQVFDLFRQGGKPRHGGYSGLGIGLALVKSLVELHGGSVSAYSDGAGTGSAFVVLLPADRPKVSLQPPGVPGTGEAEPAWATNAMLDA